MSSRLAHLRKGGAGGHHQVQQTQGQPDQGAQYGQNQYNQYQGQQNQYQYQNQNQGYQDPNISNQNPNQAYYEKQHEMHKQNLNPNYNPNYGMNQTQGSIPDQSNNDLVRRQSSGQDVMGGSQSPARKSSKSVMDYPRPLVFQEETLKYKEVICSSLSTSTQAIPPHSYQYFIQRDDGNAGPRFIRPSIYSFTNEPNVMAQTQFPQGCIVQPFSDPVGQEEPVPVSDFFTKEESENGKVVQIQSLFRCMRCHAYANPYFKFQDGGNVAVCNICQKPNKVPNEYYSPLNGYNERSDKQARPELSKAVYDMAAPSNYSKKKVTNNYIMLCLEMTPATIQSGIFAQALYSLSMALGSIPAPERTAVSICTYGSQINFYSIPKDLSNDPQLIVVSDLDDPYCPFPRNALFLNIIEDREKIDYLVEKLQKNSELVLQEAEASKIYHVKTASVGSVVQSIASMLEDHPARIIVFSSQLPTLGYGKLKRRDDVKVMNTDQEKTLYAPQDKQYQELAINLLRNSITVDLFVFSPDYCDLVTTSLLCTETGGQLYYYPHYTTSDAEKVHYELFRNLTRPYFIDCIMTVRTSLGIILEDYYTTKGKVSVKDLQMSSMNPDSVVGVMYKQEDKITTGEAYIQYACLYTNVYGQNMIRVINLALPVNTSIQNMFKQGDLDATFSLIVRRTLSNISSQTLKQLHDSLISQIVNIFYSYRNNVAASSSPSQLILPESTKYLIIYILSVLKSEVFRTNGARPDHRYYDIYRLFSFPPNQLSNFLYPKIYALHSIYENQSNLDLAPGSYIAEDKVIMPTNIPSSIDRLSSFGIYLIDNGETIFIYVMKDANPQLFEQLYGTSDYEQLREIQQYPSISDNDFAIRVNAIIDQIRRNRNGTYHNIRTVLYKDPFENNLKPFFVEDETRGIMSYNNFLCDIHKRIQSKYTS
ncbi:hypothetical protein ABPG74_011448 [Tetrahymena malaccensis]